MIILFFMSTQPLSFLLAGQEFLFQINSRVLEVHEIAITAPIALAHFVLPAAAALEFGDGAELGEDRFARVPALVQVLDGSAGCLFVAESDVNVSHQVVPQIVAHQHFFHVAVFLG